MGDRGRKPASELATVTDITEAKRQKPPSELSDKERAVWQAVVDSLPADWFPQETLPLLAQYCRHVISAHNIAALIAEYVRPENKDAFEVKEYKQLLQMQELESRAITALGRSMRITQQATYDKSKKKPKQGPKLWG